ncbi:hypothetical protein EST38_g1401 [Candolleomyces aberdarensis]|uniref:Uncharacterized protein n=1 Tax=Candolleomyces aberdarensis TaxID=2316362 RepID=A0A4Q2DW39_9AGAR|nr:hypothetical protein EST38_g1401 [Candolleomyces aberdarensis]
MDASTVQPAEASPSQSPSRSSGRGGTSNLYLVTFLATLFLLLFVSCAIVLRSYFLRRRYQRHVAQALAQGIVLTPRAPGSRKKRFGTRPHMYESWIAPLHVSGVSGSQLEKPQGGRWRDMLPMTVQTVVVKRRAKDPNATSPLSSPIIGSDPNAPSPLALLPPADRNNVRFSEVPPEVQQQQPPLRNFFSKGLSFLSSSTPAVPPPAGNTSDPNPPPPSSTTAFRQSRFGLLEMPHPNTTPFPGQEPRSEDPQITNIIRERERERRESATWRAIVSPSPSLAHAFAPTPGGSTSDLHTHRRNISLPSPAPATAGHGGEVRRPRLTLPVPTTTLNVNANNDSANVVFSPTSPGPASALGGAGTKYRIRTEMLQISVLVAMPDVRMSTLYGDAGVVKRLRAAELGGWGYRGPKLESDDGKTKSDKDADGDDAEVLKQSRRKEKAKARKEDEDEDEIVEMPGDESSSSDGEDDEEEEEEEVEHVPLPELVLGVMRLNYKHNSSGQSSPTDRSPPTFIIPSNPPPPPPVPAPVPVPASVFDPPLVHEEQVLTRHGLALAVPTETHGPSTQTQTTSASSDGLGEGQSVHAGTLSAKPEAGAQTKATGLVQSS